LKHRELPQILTDITLYCTVEVEPLKNYYNNTINNQMFSIVFTLSALAACSGTRIMDGNGQAWLDAKLAKV
jgi:hypothetical protein